MGVFQGIVVLCYKVLKTYFGVDRGYEKLKIQTKTLEQIFKSEKQQQKI